MSPEHATGIRSSISKIAKTLVTRTSRRRATDTSPGLEMISSLPPTETHFRDPVTDQDGLNSLAANLDRLSLQAVKETDSEAMEGDLSRSSSPPSPIEIPGSERHRPIEQCLPELQTIRRPPSPKSRNLGNTSYRYENLSPNGEEIRLLRIMPNESGIHCELFQAWLNSPPDYIAISYAWGDPDDTMSITLDGYDFPVTVSLWQILNRLRSEDFTVTVWADAICINQADLSERRHQVQGMTRIYKSAISVAAWIGPDYDDSYLVTDFVLELLKTNRTNPANCEHMIMSRTWTRHIVALGNILERDYWSRLWIVQEMFNSHHADIYYGSTKLSWSDLTQATEIFRRYRHLLWTWPLYRRVLKSKEALSYVLCKGGHGTIPRREVSLYDGIRLANEKLCQDPLDKIYGILGLLLPDERDLITPDYTLSKRQVYTNAVRQVITKTRRLDIILRPTSDCCTLQISRDMPTWLPDFSIPWESSSNIERSYLHASKSTNAVVSFFARQRKLEVLAVAVDSVKRTALFLPAVSYRRQLIPVFLDWCASIRVCFGPENCRAPLQALCRLLFEMSGKEKRVCMDEQAWMSDVFATIRYYVNTRKKGYLMDRQWESLANLDIRKSYDNLEPLDELHDAMAGRQFCITTSGLLSFTSGTLRKGDDIYVLLGASVPVVLRKEGTEYTYVGEAWVDGYMYGRAIDEVESGHRQVESIVLV